MEQTFNETTKNKQPQVPERTTPCIEHVFATINFILVALSGLFFGSSKRSIWRTIRSHTAVKFNRGSFSICVLPAEGGPYGDEARCGRLDARLKCSCQFAMQMCLNEMLMKQWGKAFIVFGLQPIHQFLLYVFRYSLSTLGEIESLGSGGVWSQG
jgi:hypothetical protein